MSDLNQISHCLYEDARIRIDGQSYLNCQFTRCELVYSGNEVVSFDSCRFIDSHFSFADAAANTANFIGSVLRDPGIKHMLGDLLPKG